MAIRDYNDDIHVTMASEPAVAYRTSPTVQIGKIRNGSMTVEEYFGKVRKALDKRYENL